MPWAVVQEWAAGGNDTTGYDAVAERLGTREDPPEGLIVHTAGAAADGRFRIFDVWETREAWEAFERDRLRPAIDAMIAALPAEAREAMEQPVESVYELYGFLRP